MDGVEKGEACSTGSNPAQCGEGEAGPEGDADFWSRQYNAPLTDYQRQEIRTNLMGLVHFLIENGNTKQG